MQSSPTNAASTPSNAPQINIQSAFHSKPVTTVAANKASDNVWKPGKAIPGYAAKMNKGGSLETNK